MTTPDLPLSAGEIVWCRNTTSTYLAGTAILSAYTQTPDSAGGHTDTYTAYGTSDARLAPIGARDEHLVAGRTAEVAYWILTLPATTTVNEKDRVSYNSRTYEIETVITRSPEELSRRAVCVETV